MDPRLPFTAAQARAAGITPGQLRGPGFRRLFNNVYVDSGTEVTPQLRARAALLRFGADAFASHATAGRLRGVPLPGLSDEHVSVPIAGRRCKITGIVSHVCATADLTSLRGIRVSSVGQMFVELASLLDLVDLVIVGDHLVRQATPRSLLAQCRDSALPNAARAVRAAGFVRAEVDSPMQTRLRLLLVLAGLPEPEVNLKFRSEVGDIVRRHDLAYRVARLLLEYPGPPAYRDDRAVVLGHLAARAHRRRGLAHAPVHRGRHLPHSPTDHRTSPSRARGTRRAGCPHEPLRHLATPLPRPALRHLSTSPSSPPSGRLLHPDPCPDPPVEVGGAGLTISLAVQLHLCPGEHQPGRPKLAARQPWRRSTHHPPHPTPRRCLLQQPPSHP